MKTIALSKVLFLFLLIFSGWGANAQYFNDSIVIPAGNRNFSWCSASNDYIFVSDHVHDSIYVISICTRSIVASIKTHAESNTVWGIKYAKNKILLSINDYSVEMYDASNIFNITYQQTLSGFNRGWLRSDPDDTTYFYWMEHWVQKIRIFDFSSGTMVEKSNPSTSGNVQGASRIGNILYTSNAYQTSKKIDITDPTNPVLTDFGTPGSSVMCSNSYILYDNFFNGHVISIFNPAGTLLSSINPCVLSLVTRDNYVFLYQTETGIEKFYNITNGSFEFISNVPREVSYYNENYWIASIPSQLVLYPRNTSIQASNITFSNVSGNQFNFNWTDGTAAKRAVFIKQDSLGTAAPVNNTTYTASTAFGSGSQIGTTGWYCVFNGTIHSSGVTVTNLSPGITYRVMVCEYNGAAGAETYNSSTGCNNPQNQQTCSNVIPTEGLVAWYPFNGNANDESGNGHNGTVFGTTLTTDRFGSANKAYNFNGTDNYIEVPANPALQLPNNFSIAAWIKSDETNHFQDVICKNTTDLCDFQITVVSNNAIELNKHGCSMAVQSNPFNTNNWNFVVATFSEPNAKIYVNGILDGSALSSGFFGSSLANIFIGKSWDFSSLFHGKLDDIRIYNRILTDCEITALYEEEQSFSCGGTVAYEGQTYNTVQIGTQCWFKENLNVGTRINGNQDQTNNGIFEKYCYDNLETKCDDYGGLYQWNEMMNYTISSNSNPSGRQGICPIGWHLPSDAEWCQLETFLDATVNCTETGEIGTNAGGKLKETGTTHWLTPNTGATNASGFTALGGGSRDYTTAFEDILIDSRFWTTREDNATLAWLRGQKNTNTLELRTPYLKVQGYSVRCLRELTPVSLIQASNLTFSNITNNQFTFNWTDGNGTSRAAFIKEGTEGSASPVNNTTYTPNTAFGSGSQIGTTGWYCVFNGTTHPDGITITNLSPCKTYRVMVCEYTGSPGSEIYNTSTAFKNPENVQTSGSLIVPTDGLVGYWPFNGNANDESGHGNNGTVYGATLTTDRFGNPNAAYNFNGTSYINCGSNSSLNLVNSFTLNCWGKTSSIYPNCGMIGRWTNNSNPPPDGNPQYTLYFSDSIVWSALSKTGLHDPQYYAGANFHYYDDFWHLYSICFDGNENKLYIDGQLVAIKPFLGSLYDVVNDFLIGAYSIASGHSIWWNGNIDDIRIYNRGLTETEIQALYREGTYDPIYLTSPNGGERWKVGNIHPITWTSCGVDNVKIEYSINNGTNWTTIINEIQAITGSYAWTVPDTPSELCLVKITSTTNGTIFDQSDAVFTIYTETIPQIIVTSPNGGERWKVGDIHQVTWTSSGVDNIKIEYSINSGTNWTTIIIETIASAGSYAWTVPNTPSDLCLVKISSTSDAAVFDVSDATFVIYVPESVSIVIPNAFTPNGDGYNDTYGPVTKGIGSLEMNINDRNGRLVHTIDSVNGRWDGNMPSGSAAPQGVYFYLLKAMGYDNLEYVRQGNVNLYRDLIDLTPNPVKSTAILDLTGRFSGDKTISIYSTSGILVRKFTTMEDVVRLDLSFLNAGLYILKAADQEQVIVVKFIKE